MSTIPQGRDWVGEVGQSYTCWTMSNWIRAYMLLKSKQKINSLV
jgi:hypothetical protein